MRCLVLLAGIWKVCHPGEHLGRRQEIQDQNSSRGVTSLCSAFRVWHGKYRRGEVRGSRSSTVPSLVTTPPNYNWRKNTLSRQNPRKGWPQASKTMRRSSLSTNQRTRQTACNLKVRRTKIANEASLTKSCLRAKCLMRVDWVTAAFNWN